MAELQKFEMLFKPYLTLKLSAFDNMKLVVAVLEDASQSYQCFRLNRDGQQHYVVQWQQLFIECGLENDYAASLSLLEQDVELASLTPLTVPVMALQQVSYMCMEYAHFDHC